MRKLRSIFQAVLTFKKVDNFGGGRNRTNQIGLMVTTKSKSVPVICEDFRGADIISREWLENYGETSWDHQSYYAGPIGGRAKALYYKNRWLGMAAVAPMVFSEAFFPSARRLFHHRMRLPIADAHYAMGFAFLYEATGNPAPS